MKILALDQAMQTSGYAIFDNKELKEYGIFTIKASSTIEKRLGDLWQRLNDLHNDYEFDFIVFEDIQMQHGNVETYKKLAYTQAAIILWCYFNSMKYRIYSPSSWRAIIGKGWGKKREEQKTHAIEIVKDLYDINCPSDSADAILIGTAYLKDSNGSAF